ncbi:MAG TPA: M23 family peptidase [Rhodospirillaceae bacterium]|nr:peptidase [Rhodospirillaceae bacterium]HAT35623.1 M23 family peptidase [Rhodospirillaceae bacterium]
MIRNLLIACLLAFGAQADTLDLNGKFTQGGLVLGRTDAGTKVVYEGKPIRVSRDGIFVIGFNRDAKPTASLVLTYRNGSTRREVLRISKRKYKIEAIDGLPAAKVSPPKKVIERIKRESILVALARKPDTPETHFLKGWRWPTIGRISGVYGSQRILNGVPKRPHYGIDIAAPKGTPVIAPTSGIVRMVHKDMYYSGGTMIIDHGHGVSSAFLHMETISVKKGQRVAQGERIGTVGATGRSTGPHLDWRINLFKRRLDPELLVGPMPKQGN